MTDPLALIRADLTAMQATLVADLALLDQLAAAPGPTPTPAPAPEPTPEPATAWAWPTDFHVVTQRFGANKAYYAKFGLKDGHEGTDLRARGGTNVYAAHAGTVSRVDRAHPAYGVSVRITFKEAGHDFEITYGHGQAGSVRVKVDDAVTAGQVVMLADATGNVIGGAAHLHANVKLDGVLIDPMMYFPTDGVTYL